MGKQLIIHTNQTFGRLSVVKEALPVKGRRHFVVRCVCGNKLTVSLNNLSYGHTKSCGCLFKEGNNMSHGFARHPAYQTWASMIRRCYDKNCRGYANWGGRGITVCKEWRSSPVAFIKWAEKNGFQKGNELHRLNNDKLYQPTNCQFVNKIVHRRTERTNTRWVKYKNKYRILPELVAELSLVPYTKVYDRHIRRSWPIEKAMGL